MPFTAIDIDISGQGTYDVGSAANMLFWETYLDTLGPLVRQIDSDNIDRIFQAGFITWGDNNSVIGGVDRIYWKLPVFLEWRAQIYTTGIDDLGGVPSTFVAHYFRWSLSPGTTGHIYGYAL